MNWAGALNLKEFGARGDGQTDDWPILDTAQQAILAAGGGTIFVPPAVYYLSQTLLINQMIRIAGVGSGQHGGEKSGFLFPESTVGVIIQGAGAGSIIEGMAFGSRGGQGPFDCIKMLARATVRDSAVGAFPRDGIHIEVFNDGNPSNRGNANGWAVENCYAEGCGRDGLFVQGADANAGHSKGFDASFCGGYAIRDMSFLNNTHYSPQAATNKMGAYYLGLPDPNSRNSRILLLGGYAEGDQPPSTVHGPAMLLGGIHWNGFTPDSNGTILIDGALLAGIGVVCGDGQGYLSLGGDRASGVILSYSHPQFPHVLRLKQTASGLRLDYGNQDSDVIWTLPPRA